MHAALERAPGERVAFVREACGNDESLRVEVESLLANASAAEQSTFRIAKPALDLVGQQIGTYRLESVLGAGGMGEVYRARDTKLQRDVAIKVLPAGIASDPERLARFQREARVLASLNHPHIGAIHGFEESSGIAALVLELVEGPTLAERIEKGPVSMGDALKIARQIAEALDVAHEKGIIHRDLKPANIKLTADGQVKVLDFGLAKFVPSSHQSSVPPTETLATGAGAIFGTPSYMSPEQARGLPVDKRTDVWAFGCVMYEMLTRREAFPGGTVSDRIAALLEREPDWTALPAQTPASVRRLLRRCLDKDPARRLRDIGDARAELDDVVPERASEQSPGHAWRWVAGALVALSVVAAGAALMLWRQQPAEPMRPVRFLLTPPEDHVVFGAAIPSPDGRHVVFRAVQADGSTKLWIQSLDSRVPEELPGTEGSSNPTWSPDGRHVAFGIGNDLKRVSVDGGPVQTITRIGYGPVGATWNRDGVIVYAPANQTGLSRVPASGGAAEPLTQLDKGRSENSHRYPRFLPDGDHFLFTARSDVVENTGIYVGSLSTGERKWLLSAQSPAIYIPPGFLLWVREGTLLAQPFRVDTFELSGEPTIVAGNVSHNTPSVQASFSASADGSVVSYAEAQLERASFVWFDRFGKMVAEPLIRGDFREIRLDPSGRRAAVQRPSRDDGSRDVWTVDLTTGLETRISSSASSESHPLWSPDGQQILYLSERESRAEFRVKSADGAGEEKLVWSTQGNAFPSDWSRDGQHVTFHASADFSSDRRFDLWTLPLVAGAEPTPIARTPFVETMGRFSPDGRWLAYFSNESGTEEVYVRALNGQARRRVSLGGGIQPIWTPDGKELLFIAPENRLMSAAMAPDGVSSAPPRELFVGCASTQPDVLIPRYDVSPDGLRTLWMCPGPRALSTTTIAVDAIPQASR